MQDQQFKNEAALKNLDKSKPDPQKFNRLWLAQVASEKLSKNLLSLDKKQASTADSELLEQLVELEAKLQAFVEHGKGVREQLTIQLTRSLDKLEGLLADGNMKSATGFVIGSTVFSPRWLHHQFL